MPFVVSVGNALVKDGAPVTVEPTSPLREHVNAYVLTVAVPDNTVHAPSV